MTTYGADWSKHRFYKKDPLHRIEPALLNSLDIRRYVNEGCLLEEKSFDPKRMKPASYEMKFLGTLYDWELKDGKLERRRRKIVEGQEITLSRNSISYLWIEERLRLPEYIAARFNLRISEVHKGILLGTGPLVDPGFGGRILIPLHNLTDNDYSLKGGQGIIWVEFTKVSKNCYWLLDQEGTERPSGLVEFPSRKTIDDPDAYLSKAQVVGGVQSAFRGALDKANEAAANSKKDAADAREKVEEVANRSRTIGLLAGITVFIGIVALVFSAYNISGQVADRVHRQGERIHELETMVKDLNAQSNASRVVEEPGVPEPPGPGVGEAVSPDGQTESEVGDQLADDRPSSPEPGESPAPGVR